MMKFFQRLFLYTSLLFIGNLGGIAIVQAETLKTYEVNVNRSNAKLSLTFNQVPKFSSQQTNQGLILKFSGPIKSLDLDEARSKLSPWVSSLWSSYDSILVKPRPGVSVNAKANSKTINISFRTKKVAKTPKVSADAKSHLAMERAKAILDMESGQPYRAREKLIKLSKKMPFDAQIKLDLARVEEKLNHWRAALNLYDQALVLNPKSSSIRNMRAKLLRKHGSRISLGAQYMEVGDDSRQLVLNMLDVQRMTKEKMVISVNYDRIDAEEDEGILRVNGAIRPYDVSRYRFALGLATPLKQGEQRFSLFSGAKELGLGWAYSQASNLGLSAVDIEWKRPWFQTPEAIIGYGHRDKLAFKHGKSVGKHLSLYGDASLNRYGLNTLVGAARSRRLQLGGRYKFQPTTEGFSLGYGVDWENIHELRTKTRGFFANTYTPLPLESREQHVVDVGWYKNLRHDLVLDAQLGFQYDRRRSANAPFARVFLSGNPKEKLEWKVSLESGLSTYRGQDDDYFRVASLISWYF